jgi:hypothetical protein
MKVNFSDFFGAQNWHRFERSHRFEGTMNVAPHCVEYKTCQIEALINFLGLHT